LLALALPNRHHDACVKSKKILQDIMLEEIGRIIQIYKYPIKSMAGEPLQDIILGWHGFEGDRRFAFRRLETLGGFPWLTASKLPQLLRYKPIYNYINDSPKLPTHVLTPDGRELELRSDSLQQEISSAFGSPVEIMQLDQGIFDEAHISIISNSTIDAISLQAGITLDVERFRPNILCETTSKLAFSEDAWVDKTIQIGDGDRAAKLNVYIRDLRCLMININLVNSQIDSRVLKAVSQLNQSFAGVYASVIKPGKVSLGDMLYISIS
jgi:uncharacterized protein YcbX